MKKVLVVAIATAALVAAAVPQPAPAVIHEIYAAWCAGQGEIVPPGVSDEGSKNFAMPVRAGGVVRIVPYLDGVLIDFDFDSPQAKIIAAPTGPAIVPIGPGLYLERFIIDPNFPAFANCQPLQALSG